MAGWTESLRLRSADRMRDLGAHRRRPAASPPCRQVAIAALAAGGVVAAYVLVAAVPAGWSGPTRVVSTSSQPRYSMVLDGSGKTHIAAEDDGIVYATNAGGSWTKCRISDADDREPEHRARRTAGPRRVRSPTTAVSSASCRVGLPGWLGGCGWDVVTRHAGTTTKPSVAAHGSTLHLAFRTSDAKLRYMRGAWDATSWSVHQIVDSTCCQSAPALALTTEGSPRVAFGDSSADGLKYAVPSGSSWNKRRVQRGRILHVAMVLDQTPDPWNGLQPANAPNIAYVVRNVGTSTPSRGGRAPRGRGRSGTSAPHSAPPDLAPQSNKLAMVYGRGGKVSGPIEAGGIVVGRRISASGRDGYPQIGVQGSRARS